MLGAIIGDICGSVYEWHNCKTTKPQILELIDPKWCYFTDDTVLTIATADALLQEGNYAESYKNWGLRYDRAGYGGDFRHWMHSDSSVPYNSWGNGSAMRVSPVGWGFGTLEETLAEAKRSAAVSVVNDYRVSIGELPLLFPLRYRCTTGYGGSHFPQPR